MRHDIQRRADRNGCVLFLLDDCRRRDSSILGEIVRCHVGVVERVDRVLEAANVATKTRHRTQRGDRSGDGRRGRRSGTRMRATTGRGDATQHDRCNRRSCPSRSHRQRLHPATLPVRAPRHGFFDPGCPFPPGAGIESDDPDGPPRERARALSVRAAGARVVRVVRVVDPGSSTAVTPHRARPDRGDGPRCCAPQVTAITRLPSPGRCATPGGCRAPSARRGSRSRPTPRARRCAGAPRRPRLST